MPEDDLKALFYGLREEVRVGFTSINENLRKLVESDDRTQKTLNDHEARLRAIEKTKKDRLPPNITAAFIAAVVALLIFAAPYVIK